MDGVLQSLCESVGEAGPAGAPNPPHTVGDLLRHARRRCLILKLVDQRVEAMLGVYVHLKPCRVVVVGCKDYCIGWRICIRQLEYVIALI